MELPFAESWKIKMVEPIRKSTREAVSYTHLTLPTSDLV